MMSSLSASARDQSGSSAAAAPSEEQPTRAPKSPEQASFTSFPEGEGAIHPDIPAEPMLNKIYNKVLSLATSGKSPIPSTTPTLQAQLPPPFELEVPPQSTPTGLGISLGSAHQSKNPSVSSIPPVDASTAPLPNPSAAPEKTESTSSRQSMVRPIEKKTANVLEPVVSTVHALGGLTRSEDEFSIAGSEKPQSEPAKSTTRAHIREINLPGLGGFRLTREPSSDSESISSYTAHPARTVKSIIGRLKTGDLGREFWMKDETSHECFLCGEKFTSIRLPLDIG